MGIYFIVEHNFRERPTSMDQLTDIVGTLDHYSFRDNIGLKKQSHEYFISLDEYPNKFQIKSDYLQFFNKYLFEESVQKGHHIKITVPNYKKQLIGTDETVVITSLSANSLEFLSKQETINYEIDSSQSNSDYIFGGTLIIIALLYFFLHGKFKIL